MKIGLVGPSYQERSLPFDAQRTINMFPVINETGQGKEVAALYGTPGLDFYAYMFYGPNPALTGAVRGLFSCANGRAFGVMYGGFFEVYSNNLTSYIGALNSVSSICSFAESPTQLAICDGTDLYIFTYATNTLTEVTDADFPGGSTVTFQDGYFIVGKPGSGEFYISGLNDGLSWNALDFATAESSPDSLVRVYSAYGQLWLIGERSTEVWYNTGDADFPFSRIEGAKMQVGTAAAHSVADMDNSLIWLGQDKDGRGIVYQATGYSPVRISTHAIEYLLSLATSLADVRAYTYQQDGHLFYVLTGGGLLTSLCYDAATKLWHERANLEEDGSLTIHTASCCMFAFGKHIVGHKSAGYLYEMSLDQYEDEEPGGTSTEIYRQRIFTHIHKEAERMRFNELQVDFEYGVGLPSGQGSNPVASLAFSTDGGKTWSSEYTASIGALGNYNARAVWRNLGISESMTFRITITDPVKIAICGAYLK